MWKYVLLHGVLKMGSFFLLAPFLVFFLMDVYNYLYGPNQKYLFDDYSWSPHIYRHLAFYLVLTALGGAIVGLFTYRKKIQEFS